jgi:hypothetical protein
VSLLRPAFLLVCHIIVTISNKNNNKPEKSFSSSRRKAIQVLYLHKSFRRQIEPARARANALSYQASRVWSMWEGVRVEVLPVQARGVLLHEASRCLVQAAAFAPTDRASARESPRHRHHRLKEGIHYKLRLKIKITGNLTFKNSH